MMAVFVIRIALFVSAAVANAAVALATVFTDAQWADIQSFLNFVVLTYVAYHQQKIRTDALGAVDNAVAAVREAPVATAKATKTQITKDLRDGDDDLHGALLDVIAEALAERRRRIDR